MDPISAMLFALIVSAIFVGKTTEGVIHAAKGTTPPSLQRERERLAAEQKRLDTLRDISKETGEPVQIERRYGWGNVLDDASNLAAMIAGRVLQNRRERLTKDAQARADKNVSAAEDRLMEAYGYGPRGSKGDSDQPAASAPDGIDPAAGETTAGASDGSDTTGTSGGSTPPPSETEPAVGPTGPTTGTVPDAGAPGSHGKCNWRDTCPDDPSIVEVCGDDPAGNMLTLCAGHDAQVPARSALVNPLLQYPGRCQWTNKVFTYAELRCTDKVERGGEIDGKPWPFCRSHRVGSSMQQRISTALDAGQQSRNSSKPTTPTTPGPGGDKPGGVERDTCNWASWAGPGVTAFCPSAAAGSSPAGLCERHEQEAPQVSSLVQGEIAPGRCDWNFKNLPFGTLRCLSNAAGSGGHPQGCEAHGGTAPHGKPEDNADGDRAGGKRTTEPKEGADGKPACTHDMNCKACVLVGGKPTCLSDLNPQDGTNTPDQPTEPQEDTGSTAPPSTTGANVTSTETANTSESAGLEAATLGGAKAYLSASIAEAQRAAADVDMKIGTMREQGEMSDGPTLDAMEAAKDAYTSTAAQLQDALTKLGEGSDGIKEGYEANPEAGNKRFIVGE